MPLLGKVLERGNRGLAIKLPLKKYHYLSTGTLDFPIPPKPGPPIYEAYHVPETIEVPCGISINSRKSSATKNKY